MIDKTNEEKLRILQERLASIQQKKEIQQEDKIHHNKPVSPVFEDALRQLGMPYTAFYWVYKGDGTHRVDHFPVLPHYGDEAKGKCDWKTIWKSRTPEDQAGLMKPIDVLDLEKEMLLQLAEASTAVGEVWSGDLRPWLKKDKWIQIERVPFKEVTND